MNGIKLIVGLGNPGGEYAKTRHNAGFWFVDEICQKYKTSLNVSPKFYGESAKVKIGSGECLVLKPNTFMNLSGKAVLALVVFYKILPAEILVVHDELDFDVGVCKLKKGGGNGGHNGLKDIDRVIGKDYWRLRIGVGHPGDKNKVVSYVLKRPNTEEFIDIFCVIDKGIAIIPDLLEGKFNEAMKVLHTLPN